MRKLLYKWFTDFFSEELQEEGKIFENGGYLSACQIGRYLQAPGSVVNLRKNMTMAVNFHGCAKIRIIFGVTAGLAQ